MDSASEVLGRSRPSSLMEVGLRISQVLDRLPSRVEAARVCGRSVDSIWAWTKGANEPPFLPVAKLAIAAGVRVEWVATGEGPIESDAPPGTSDTAVNIELLKGCIELLKETGRQFTPAQEAEAVSLLYDLAMAEPEGGRVHWLHTKGQRIVRVAG